MTSNPDKTIHRADHCGSLLRPQPLRDARLEHALGRLDAGALRTIEDQSILDVLAMQRAVGLSIYSDGEFRRKSWHHALEIMRKIDAATKYVPLDLLALCPNCGFSGMAADAWVTQDVQRRKLEFLVATASRIWREKAS